jgi:hypothetical protein
VGARVPREAGDITTGSWASERDLEDKIETVEITADGGANQHRLTAALERAGSGVEDSSTAASGESRAGQAACLCAVWEREDERLRGSMDRQGLFPN